MHLDNIHSHMTTNIVAHLAQGHSIFTQTKNIAKICISLPLFVHPTTCHHVRTFLVAIVVATVDRVVCYVHFYIFSHLFLSAPFLFSLLVFLLSCACLVECVPLRRCVLLLCSLSLFGVLCITSLWCGWHKSYISTCSLCGACHVVHAA